MSKHTAGPWFIWSELAMRREGMEPDEIAHELLFEDEFQIYAGYPVECTRGILRGHSAHVCDIDADSFPFDGDSFPFDEDDDYDYEETQKATALANARLIAAAPELLAALKSVKAWDVENLALDIPLQIRIQMQAAIDKAEGGAA